MKIQVLGTGCPSCHKLFDLAKQAVKELNLKEEVEYVDDIKKIIEMGVMQMPVLAIDGKPILTGSVSDIERIKNLLMNRGVIDSGDDNPKCSCKGKC